jgi:undecaprenyl diphosphate synthase
MSFHVAIIMDGNGRWAKSRSLPRLAGHERGAAAVQRAIESAARLGVDHLTLYAFSSDNWRRPTDEVSGLMRLFRAYLESEIENCLDSGVRLSVIGRRDRLPAGIPELICTAERKTRDCSRIHVRLAVDYSSRDTLLQAARGCTELSREALSAALPAPDVDLLIRTGGEQRLSDFLLWECAYAEFFFTQTMWPDFGEEDLREAIATFRSRQRRFGALPAA